MTPITETSAFSSSVNLLDITDPVLGGLTGQENNPLIALTNRTRYLFNYLNFYDFVKIATSTAILPAVHSKKCIEINAAGNITLTLDDLNNWDIGIPVTFKSKCAAGKIITISAFPGQNIVNGNTSKAAMWMCDGETLVLVADFDGTNWYWNVMHFNGNFYNAGEDMLVRKMPANSIVANGCTPESGGSLLSRTDFARLWDAVKTDVITDATWLSDALLYRGFFSDGDGVTTFRVPDLRSMFMRGLDLGRGINLSRANPSLAGGFEMDDIKSHSHTNINQPTGKGQRGTADVKFLRENGSNPESGLLGNYPATDATGGFETNVKNIGKIPVILY